MSNNIDTSRYAQSFTILAKNRNIFLCEDVNKEVASIFTGLLLYYDSQDNNEDITIYINSNGGDISALYSMLDFIHLIQSPIKTICIGKAYSAAAMILAAGAKNKRYATKNSSMMIHGIQCVFPTKPGSDRRDAEIEMKFLVEHNKQLMKYLSKYTGKPLEETVKDCEDDKFFNAKEALNYGLIDHII
jgi:ATP-dependent Clp protease protease subunit